MNIHDPFNLLKTKKESIGKPPGNLIYSGSYSDVDISIGIITYDDKGLQIKYSIDINNLSDMLKKITDKEHAYWLNITGLHNQDIIKSIGDILEIHHMDLEDIVHVSQWSKILNQEDYLFSVLKMIYLMDDEIKHEHVSVILKDNIVITFQETPGDVFDNIRNRFDNLNGGLSFKNSIYLYYSLLDAIVDEYIVVINHISVKFNELEMKIIEGESLEKEEFYRLRKELLYFSNSITPLLDSLKVFIMRENQFYTHAMEPYYADLNEHLNQISHSIKAYREMSNSLHDMHMSDVSLKMNKAMMTLTIFSAILIPLSFLAGVFGMNFKYMPGLDNPYSFLYFIGFCAIGASSMLTYFKMKGWF